MLVRLVMGPLVLGWLVPAVFGPAPDDGRSGTPAGEVRPEALPAEPQLRMTSAVACVSIEGYRSYEPLPEPSLSRDDKLLLYYEPENFAVEESGGKFRVHFTQDVRIRRRGEKPVLWSKENLLDSKREGPEPPSGLYLYNRIALKDLKPGEYDLDIVLHDRFGKGPAARQTFRFTVKPSVGSPPGGTGEKGEPASGEGEAGSP